MTRGANRVRLFLLVEVAIFLLAALLHRGLLARGHEHARAAIAESVVALVLASGLAVSVFRQLSARAAALWAQGIALLGVAIGTVTMSIGIGPRGALDYGIHAVMALTLVAGLALAAGQPQP